MWVNTVKHILINIFLYVILSCGHVPIAGILFGQQRRSIRIISSKNNREDCRYAFKGLKILRFPCLHIMECLRYIKLNHQQYSNISEMHDNNTRIRSGIALNHQRKMFTKLTFHVGELFTPLFRSKIIHFYARAFYYTFWILHLYFCPKFYYSILIFKCLLCIVCRWQVCCTDICVYTYINNWYSSVLLSPYLCTVILKL